MDAPQTRSEVLGRVPSVALVGAGGFVGAALRHAVALSLPSAALGTLAVNVAGSFALGLVLSRSWDRAWLTAERRLLVGTGLLSSFTTYSTFAVQTTALSPAAAVGYVVATYGLGFLAVVAAGALVRCVP